MFAKTLGVAAGVEEIVVSLFDAFNRRDLDGALLLLDPEIVFEPVTRVVLNDGEPYRGHEGMRRYFEDVQRHWSELRVNPVQVRSAGAAVVALGQTTGRAAGSLTGAPTTWVFKFKDGLVARIQVFSDERLARQALGVQNQPIEAD
jgi:ketosteroid isomerase-like protein